MSRHADPERFPGYRPDLASAILGVGLEPGETPAEELCTELTRDGGEAWLARLLEPGHFGSDYPGGESLRKGAVEWDDLLTLKERSKHLRERARSAEERSAALFLYVLSQAGAVVHHGRLLSPARRARDLEPVLADLIHTTPEPWATFFSRAREELTGPGD